MDPDLSIDTRKLYEFALSVGSSRYKPIIVFNAWAAGRRRVLQLDKDGRHPCVYRTLTRLPYRLLSLMELPLTYALANRHLRYDKAEKRYYLNGV